MLNSLRAAWKMPPLKFTPVTPKLTEAVTAIALDLKKQTLEWLEIRRNDTAPHGRFLFRPNIYEAQSSETLQAGTCDLDKYTVFTRTIDLSDNGKVTTTISHENADAETAFGMLAFHEMQDRMRDPEGKKRLFPDIVSRAKLAPPGFGFLEVAAERGIVATAEASFREDLLKSPANTGPT